jgi:hypothetical protein
MIALGTLENVLRSRTASFRLFAIFVAVVALGNNKIRLKFKTCLVILNLKKILLSQIYACMLLCRSYKKK